MQLSILIPMYNAENYVENCLNSLMNQDLNPKDFEVIIMDDGSTDNSNKIVNNFIKRHSNVFLFTENNAGSDSTRNKLLKKAIGDYIYFLDADDYLAYHSLGIIMKYLINNNLDFIGFDTLKTTDLSRFECIKETIEDSVLTIQSGLEYIEENRNLKHEVWWYITKRSLIDNNKITFDENGNNADVIFTLKLLLKANKLFYLNYPIHRYVQTTGSVMRVISSKQKRKLNESMFSMIISYSKLINSLNNDYYKNKQKVIENLKYRRDVFTFFNIMNMIRLDYTKKEVKEKINNLTSLDAYPIKHFILFEYNTFKYIFLTKLINVKPFLFLAVLFRNYLSNTKAVLLI